MTGGVARWAGIESHEFLRSVLADGNDLIVAFDAAGTIVCATGATSATVGRTPTELVGTSVWDLVHPEEQARLPTCLDVAHRLRAPWVFDVFRLRHRDGTWTTFQLSFSGARHVEADLSVFFARRSTGIGALDQVLDRLLGDDDRNELLVPALDAVGWSDMGSRVGICWPEGRRRRYLSTGLPAELCGTEAGAPWDVARDRGEPVILDDLDRLDPTLRSTAAALGLEACWIEPVGFRAEGERATLTLWTRPGVNPKLHEFGMTTAKVRVELALRFTEQRAALQHAASHDLLTGLANRGALVAALDGEVGGGALLFCDLDRFKPVNDSFGHGAGDDVLKVVGERLVSCVRAGDVVARVGGDEFVVLCRGLDREGVDRVARRIVEVVSEPIVLGAVTVEVGASVGVAFDAVRLDRGALAAADGALYAAKSAGRGGVRWAEDLTAPGTGMRLASPLAQVAEPARDRPARVEPAGPAEAPPHPDRDWAAPELGTTTGHDERVGSSTRSTTSRLDDPAFVTSLLATTNEMIVAFDDGGTISFAGGAVVETLGWSPEEMVGRPVWDFTHPDDLERAISQAVASTERSSYPGAAIFRGLHQERGSVPLYVTSGSAIDGGRRHLVIFCRPADQLEAQRLTVEGLFGGKPLDEVLGHALGVDLWWGLGSAVGVCWTDEDGRHQVGAALPAELCGGVVSEPWQTVARTGVAIVHDGLGSLDEQTRARACAAAWGGYWIEPVRFHDDREPALISLWTRPGVDPAVHEQGMDKLRTYVEVAFRFTEQRSALQHAASHDLLTGLANRGALVAALDGQVGGGALLYCDLDRFKPVNDSFGHGAGDDVLKVVGERLASCVRAGDVVARMGGDEFVVLCRGLDREGVDRVARRIVAVVSEPIVLGATTVEVGASVGVAFDAEGLDRHALDAADGALYEAKSAGRGMVCWADAAT